MNKYNQNFQGVYCTCHRPYPDLEDEVQGVHINNLLGLLRFIMFYN